MNKHILIVASTFPASDDDPVPDFVKSQITAMHQAEPGLKFSVLAPHDKRSKTKRFSSHKTYDEYRFHYAWPRAVEKLAGRGIMPALKANPANYLLIPFLFIGEFFALWRLARKLRPDVIYAHWFTPQAVNARLVGAFTKVPFVFTTHASDVDVWHKIPLIGRLVVRSNTRKAIAFTAVSRRSMEKLANFFSKTEWSQLKERSSIIPMGVNLPNATTSNTDDQEQVILFVGRLTEKKGVQFLLPAFKKLKQTIGDIKLIIAGDGIMLSQLQKQTSELELDKSVTFPGFVSGKTKQALIASADVYVVPSIITSDGDAEGLPVSLMEGLAYGKVCIASFESGADDILMDGKDGFLVPQKDTDALHKALVKATSLTPSSRTKLQAAAKVTAEQFSWPKVARRHIEFLFKDNND